MTLAPLCGDRMPVLLSGADIAGWLDGTLDKEGLKPAVASALRERTVSKRVNRMASGMMIQPSLNGQRQHRECRDTLHLNDRHHGAFKRVVHPDLDQGGGNS